MQVQFNEIQANLPKMGEYKKTTIDLKKENADFLLQSVSPYYIKWKGGKIEKVTKSQLAKLQIAHSWMTDF